ncbi:MAG: type II toxin-antitoxin system VapB family antitoxin [Pseudomonadota bacterium]
MPLYIRDEDVNALADKVTKITGAQNKTEAVRAALQAQLDTVEKKKPLIERVHELQAKADKIGKVDPNFDMKKFSDEIWGDS